MSKKVLVVDDEESIRFTFECFLHDEGYDVATAANLVEASAKIADCDFDLVFVDILLAGHNGIDVLRQIKARNPLCPVVMVTGFPSIDTASEALRLGAHDYIPKPIKQETLIRVARNALDFKALQEEKKLYQANLEAIFDSVKDGIITVDNSLSVVERNGAAEKLCGLSRQGLGVNLKELTEYCNGKCTAILEAAIASRDAQEVHRFKCDHRKRRPQIVTLNASPLLDRQGATSGAVLVVRDETRLHALERDLKQRHRFHKIIGQSERMQEIYRLLDKLANVPTTVLVTGESGTGKELIADALHYQGARRDKPLVKVNCAALSESLLESELFGHVKGAFTGAVRDSVGRFEKADGGTIFLDEIGDVSPRLQVQLLRVLQEKVIERVGDSKPIPVDVRVAAATNQDLGEKIRRGEFREDLFYRLKVVHVNLPPLRQRRQDIPLLVEHLIEKFNVSLGKNVTGVSSEVQKFFFSHAWPGNVRELEHVIEHGFILCEGPVLSLEHLPPDLLQQPLSGSAAGTSQPSDMPEAIRQALKDAGGNKAKAARLLGVSRRTIYRKLEEFQIDCPM